MAWTDVTLETDAWTDVTNQAIFVKDQNEDIITDQNGSPLIVQTGLSTEWTTIT